MAERIRCKGWGLAGAGAWLVAALAARAAGQVTQRVSLDSSGAQGNGQCNTIAPAVATDGRYVAFPSESSNLVAGDTNGVLDVFVRERLSGTTERVSVDSAGTQGNDRSYAPSLSSDGRHATFSSYASNLVAGDTNGFRDMFVRDRLLGTTERVSLDSSGTQGNDESYAGSISGDGRYVVFRSRASNLVAGDTNGALDVFVHDRVSGATERVSVDSSGNQANGQSDYNWISVDGRYVAFSSSATNLVPGDTNGTRDVFLRDRQSGTTILVSVDSSGVQGNGQSLNPFLSGNGRYVSFSSHATNFVAVDSNGNYEDVFVRDLQTGTTELASVNSFAVQGNSLSLNSSISDDGRFVAFESHSSNLDPEDDNSATDVFVRDRLSGTTELASVDSGGSVGNSPSLFPQISGDGCYVVFMSFADDLVPGDTNRLDDIFLHDRLGSPSSTSLCDPGDSGVIACPCSNPPGGAGRGCDNSSNTGGAVLTTAGGTYLSSDSLVFATSGEKPTALSIVAQWTGGNPTGVIFGMGVRCTSGALKRLYTKSAVAGSITAPDFGAGDPPASARSAALGDTILAGQSRWYLVYYRDPIVLGGCPAISTFNATQTAQVAWSP